MYSFDVLAMADLFSPDVYLAFTAVAQKAVDKLIYTRHQQKGGEPTLFRCGNSEIKIAVDVPLNNLLAREGLGIGDDRCFQRFMDSLAHPRHWWKARKGYDLVLMIFLDCFMTAISAVGTPALGYAIGWFGVSRMVGLMGSLPCRSSNHERLLPWKDEADLWEGIF